MRFVGWFRPSHWIDQRAHFGIYLVQEEFTGAGWVWGLLCAALVALIAWLSALELGVQMEGA
jgi:hypothetical protein